MNQIQINAKPHQKQYQAYQLLRDTVTRFLLFGGAANGGKSWLGCEWLLLMCLRYPESRWFIGRDELKRLRESTLVTFYKVLRFHEVPRSVWKWNGQDYYFLFANGSRISLLDLKYLPSDPMYDRYGSLEYTGGWIEEAGEVHFSAFDTLKGRIGRHNNDEYGLMRKMLITSNPKKNWLYQYFYKPWRNENLPLDYAFIPSLVTDNPYRERGSAEALESIENNAQRERLRYGNWDYEEEPDQLIKYEWIQEAIDIVLPKAGKQKLGIDVARYGDDKTVFCRLQGNHLTEMKAWQGIDTTQSAQYAAQDIEEHGIDTDLVGVDVVGLGAGTVDHLNALGYEVIEISAGAKPVNDAMQKESTYEFADLRSQMWWHTREQLRTGQVSLTEEYPLLLEDLTAPRYEIRQEKVIKVESKESIKQRIGRSTDYGDAFVQAQFVERMQKPILTAV